MLGFITALRLFFSNKEELIALHINVFVVLINSVANALGMIAALARNNLINDERETELIQMTLAWNSDVSTLAKYDVTDLNKCFLILRTSYL